MSMDLVREHFEEHPEEYREILKRKNLSSFIEQEIETRKKEKLERVERWKQIYEERKRRRNSGGSDQKSRTNRVRRGTRKNTV